jgi:phosphoserine phosphatase RsbU/P
MRLLLRRAARGLGRQPVWITVALVLDVAIAVTGILIGPRFNLTGALAVGPLLACARCNGRLTALAAGFALALCALVAGVIGTVSAADEGYHFGAVIVAGALAVLIAVIRTRRESALITISERVQHAILRPLPAEIGGMAFASHYQSATSAALVGGDLYDIAMTQFGPRLIIGDVKGKGLEAVGRCAAVLAIFREMAFGEPGLTGLAEKMNARLSRDMEAEDFVTVILAEFAPGEVRIVNCGHHPPVKLAAGAGELQVMAPEEFAPPLGLNPHPARQDIDLKPGDRLLFYTDGLVESRDRAGRFFGLDDRVAAALALPDLGAAVKRVVRLLLEHARDGLADDVLLVLGEPRPDAQPDPLADPPADVI